MLFFCLSSSQWNALTRCANSHGRDLKKGFCTQKFVYFLTVAPAHPFKKKKKVCYTFPGKPPLPTVEWWLVTLPGQVRDETFTLCLLPLPLIPPLLFYPLSISSFFYKLPFLPPLPHLRIPPMCGKDGHKNNVMAGDTGCGCRGRN